MSDNIQQKYTNTYIDKTVGMVHEYINMVIQLRTRLQLANDLITEKDQVISTLQNERESALSEINEETEKASNLSKELISLRENAKNWETECNSMRSKVSHMDSLSNQINEMKQGLISKNDELDKAIIKIRDLEKQISEFQMSSSGKDDIIKNLTKTVESLPTVSSPKKVINSKKSKTIVPPTEETDDF